METITIDEFIERLGQYKGKNIVAELEGNINTEIDMNLTEIEQEKGFIEITFNKTKRKICGDKFRINIHQIKKIESDEDTELYVYFDSNQKIIFFTDFDVLLCYHVQKVREHFLCR